MSNRQQSKLKNFKLEDALKVHGSENEIEDEDILDKNQSHKSRVLFQFEEDTDESNDEDVNSTHILGSSDGYSFQNQESLEEKVSVTADESTNRTRSSTDRSYAGKKQKKKLSDKKTTNENFNNLEDISAFEHLLEELKVEVSLTNKDECYINIQCFFEIDPKSLDMDAVLRRRFGRNIPLNGVNNNNQNIPEIHNFNHRIKPKKLLIGKKYLFGEPKEDWSIPPSYVGGEYEKIDRRIRKVLDKGDINKLIIVLSQHSYHTEGFLQLARTYARLGQMDRSLDYVRRALFIYERSFIESFKPYNGLCRMDSQRKENRVFFDALYLYMQISSMMGCSALAMDLARIILSLDLQHDSFHILLTLDYHCMQAARVDLIINCFGWKDIESISVPDTYWMDINWKNQNSLQVGSGIAVIDMPNWWYSIALGTFNHISNSSSNSSSDKLKLANTLLKVAIFKWPFIMSSLIETIPAISKGYFSDPLTRPDEISVLLHIRDIYFTRCEQLWKPIEVQNWASKMIIEMLQDISYLPRPQFATNANEHDQKVSTVNVSSLMKDNHDRMKKVSEREALQIYRSADLDDYREAFPRLPPDVHPIEPQLMDRRILEGGVAFPPEVLAMALFDINQDEENSEGDVGTPSRRRRQRIHIDEADGNQNETRRQYQYQLNSLLDLRLPLMQLFLASFLPWYQLPYYNRGS